MISDREKYESDRSRVKVGIVVSSPMTIQAFLQEQIRRLSIEYDLTVIANLSSPLVLLPGSKVTLCNVAIERKISPWKDLKALLVLLRLFRKNKFRLVHSVTPKAGLLAMSAAYFAGVPNRMHTFTGQVWVTRRGIMRSFLRWMDRVIFRFSTKVLVDSHSQRDFLLAERVITASASSVLLQGSISGVDVIRFSPSGETRMKVRKDLGISEDALVYVFLGRLNRDKGINDLVQAFDRLVTDMQGAVLLVIGPDEEGVQKQVAASVESAAGHILFVKYTNRPEDYLNAADVFCLPSYREGFGSVIIEAAAVGIPAIGSRIYGVSDAIVDGVTGFLHKAGDIDSIYQHMKTLGQDRNMRNKMGETARQRVLEHFTTDLLADAVVEEYKEILKSTR